MVKPSAHKGEGHRARLRERFLSSGLDGFHDYEVIELLLTLGTPRKDCKQSAKTLLKKFKSFQLVFEASPSELESIDGLGPKNTFGIKLIKAVSDRYLQKRIIGKNPIQSSKEVLDYLNHFLRDRQRECFFVIYLDAKNRIKETETLFEGSLTSSVVYPREVVRSALHHHPLRPLFLFITILPGIQCPQRKIWPSRGSLFLPAG